MPEVTIYFQDDLWNDLKAYKARIDRHPGNSGVSQDGGVDIEALVRIAVRGFLVMAMEGEE
jgi:hypothetical protein